MKKLIIALVLMVSSVFAGEYYCPFDKDEPARSQITSCKLSILKHECEQQNIQIWSSIDVSNYMVNRDQIATHASCDSMNIYVNAVDVRDNQMVVNYNLIKSEQNVQSFSRDKFKDVKVAAQTSSTSITKVTKKDSSYVLGVNLSFQLDSKDLKRAADETVQKSKEIWAIITK